MSRAVALPTWRPTNMTDISRHDTSLGIRQGTEGKLATDAINGDHEKGFPSDLVKTTRAMLSALHAVSVWEDFRFRCGTTLTKSKAIGQATRGTDRYAMAHVLCGDRNRSGRRRDRGVSPKGGQR
jgi:hypothetical protein